MIRAVCHRAQTSLVACAIAAASFGWPLLAFAQSEPFPSKTITLVGQNAPGGANDLALRVIAEHFRQLTGKNMIVDNKPGANGAVALAYLRTQKADGHTLSLAGRSAISQFWITNGKAGYHPLEDFSYVSILGAASLAVVAKADGPFKTLDDVVRAARERPGSITVATVGIGSPHHHALEAWMSKAGIKMQQVPYKGDLPSLTAVWSNEVSIAISGGIYNEWVKDGRMRLLAVTSEDRHPKYPAVPSFTDLGYDPTGMLAFVFAAPKGVDPAVVSYLDGTFRKISEDKVFQEKLHALGIIPVYRDSKDAMKFVRDRFPLEKELLERAGVINK